MIWKIIKIAMIRADIGSIVELAQVTGINPATLTQTRRRNPRSFRLYELAQIDKAVRFTSEEWMQIREAMA
jgi:hypothetical protein